MSLYSKNLKVIEIEGQKYVKYEIALELYTGLEKAKAEIEKLDILVDELLMETENDKGSLINMADRLKLAAEESYQWQTKYYELRKGKVKRPVISGWLRGGAGLAYTPIRIVPHIELGAKFRIYQSLHLYTAIGYPSSSAGLQIDF